MFKSNRIIQVYTELRGYIRQQITLHKQQQLVSGSPRVLAVIEMPKGCAYKLDYDKGVYWVRRPLEQYRQLSTAYGFIQNVIGPNGKQIDALIYIPASVPSTHINNSQVGYSCIPLMGFSGFTTQQEVNVLKEYKILLIPEIFLQVVFNDHLELVNTVIDIVCSFYTNYESRIKKGESNVFRLDELIGYNKTNAIINSHTIK